MSVLNFAAHILQMEVQGSEGHYDEETGNYVASSSSSWEEVCKCDIVPGGKAATITLPDGTLTNYSYTIYLPKDCKEFSFGDNIRLLLYGKQARQFKVLGFHRYQHQCKIWV